MLRLSFYMFFVIVALLDDAIIIFLARLYGVRVSGSIAQSQAPIPIRPSGRFHSFMSFLPSSLANIASSRFIQQEASPMEWAASIMLPRMRLPSFTLFTSSQGARTMTMVARHSRDRSPLPSPLRSSCAVGRMFPCSVRQR